MHNLVGTHVASLRKRLVANVALVRSLAGVSSLVGLKVTELREALSASWFFADLQEALRPDFGVDVCKRLTNGLTPVCARVWISRWVFW